MNQGSSTRQQHAAYVLVLLLSFCLSLFLPFSFCCLLLLRSCLLLRFFILFALPFLCLCCVFTSHVLALLGCKAFYCSAIFLSQIWWSLHQFFVSLPQVNTLFLIFTQLAVSLAWKYRAEINVQLLGKSVSYNKFTHHPLTILVVAFSACNLLLSAFNLSTFCKEQM